MDERPVRRVAANQYAPDETGEWPTSIPAVAQILGDGLDLPPGATLLVGENGSGKSTIVEAAAMAFGLSPEGGSTHAQHSTYQTESKLLEVAPADPLAGCLALGLLPARRDDDGFYTYLADNPGSTRGPDFHRLQPRGVVPRAAPHTLRLTRARPPRRAQGRPVLSAQIALVSTLASSPPVAPRCCARPTPRWSRLSRSEPARGRRLGAPGVDVRRPRARRPLAALPRRADEDIRHVL